MIPIFHHQVLPLLKVRYVRQGSHVSNVALYGNYDSNLLTIRQKGSQNYPAPILILIVQHQKLGLFAFQRVEAILDPCPKGDGRGRVSNFVSWDVKNRGLGITGQYYI
jgi:hypothetical protein